MSTQGLDKKTLIIASICYILTLLFMLLVYFTATTYHIPFKEITGDPALTFEAHPFTGIVSNIGVLLWCATTAVLLFSYFLLKESSSKKNALFLLYSGLITGILLIDDLFMFHDYIFYSVGLNQYVMYSIYLIIFAGYFLYFRDLLIQVPNKILLLLAFFFLGGSVGLDVLIKSEGMQYFFEDGLKLFGITSWFLFFIFYCFQKTNKITKL